MKLHLIMAMVLGAGVTGAGAATPVTQAKIVADESAILLNGARPGEVFAGCSWYCADVAPTESASSVLESADGRYAAGKAHDFDFRTAWVEGKKDAGKGEWLEYLFDLPETPEKPAGFGVDELVIFNGYWKSEVLWKENARVKILEMSVDGRPFMTIELADVMKIQTVSFPLVPLKAGDKIRFRFTIRDVYPGTKHQDTAISELLFDGKGDH